MENNDTFAVFILTHGRPDNVITLNTLKKCGYTGKVYFIVDNEDKSVDRYIKNFGKDNVIVFSKKDMIENIDRCDNLGNTNIVLFARNACFDIAKKLNIKYFLELDDDYTSFEFRYADKNNKKLLVKSVFNIDFIISKYLEFYKNTNFVSIAFAQGGDFIGGVENNTAKFRPLLRKCMNSFFCSSDRPFVFTGAINEDVNAYVTLGSRGMLFGTVPMVSVVQKATQSQTGGLTDIYLLSGTYIKSFYTVLMHPSSVRVSMMCTTHPRLHHQIKWNNTVPLIISEKYKKQ
jgi:hypothetical protein